MVISQATILVVVTFPLSVYITVPLAEHSVYIIAADNSLFFDTHAFTSDVYWVAWISCYFKGPRCPPLFGMVPGVPLSLKGPRCSPLFGMVPGVPLSLEWSQVFPSLWNGPRCSPLFGRCSLLFGMVPGVPLSLEWSQVFPSLWNGPRCSLLPISGCNSHELLIKGALEMMV